MRAQQTTQTLDGFGQRLLHAIPVAPEADPLATIALAARSFPRPDAERQILMISSGLSTVDPWNMATGENLYLDPDTVTAQLSQHGLPDLTGITVYWSGMGDTLGSIQTPLDIEARSLLIRSWTRVIAAAHGKLVVLDAPLPPVDPGGIVPHLPTVSPVFVRDGGPITSPVRLDDNSVKFRPNSDQYLDEPAALAVLTPIAKRLIATGTHVTLTGTASRQLSTAQQRSTGLARARRVRTTLESLGVRDGQLAVATVGSDWACWVNERRADGSIDEAIASSNRSIVITADGQTIDQVCQ